MPEKDTIAKSITNMILARDIWGKVLFNIRAAKSLPPVEAFFLMVIPMPTPVRTPPNTDDTNKSLNDIFIKEVSSRKSERKTMPIRVLTSASF